MTRFSEYFTDNHQNLINLNLNRVRPGQINTEVSGGFGNHDVVLQSHVIESLKDNHLSKNSPIQFHVIISCYDLNFRPQLEWSSVLVILFVRVENFH